MIFPAGALAVAAGFENRTVLLFVEPAEKFLESLVGKDFFHGVELITQLVVRPGLVDEIFAAMARRGDFTSALATGHDVVSARGNGPFAEGAGVIHREIVEPRNTRNTQKGHEKHGRTRYSPACRTGGKVFSARLQFVV